MIIGLAELLEYLISSEKSFVSTACDRIYDFLTQNFPESTLSLCRPLAIEGVSY